MHPRLNAYTIAPEIPQQAVRLQAAIDAIGIDHQLAELIKLRVSQINGCAYCLHMHSLDARKRGMAEARLNVLPAWRESTLFTPAERAVLAFTEALTRVSEHGAPDALYADVKQHFSDKEVVGLVHAIAMINFWNRSAIALGMVHPAERAAAE